MASAPFIYRDLWDVPRMIVCDVCETQILLDSEFDESRDEFSSEYKVYVLSKELKPGSIKSWIDLPEKALACLGRIPVSAIAFDLSRRKTLDATPIEALLRATGHPKA